MIGWFWEDVNFSREIWECTVVFGECLIFGLLTGIVGDILGFGLWKDESAGSVNGGDEGWLGWTLVYLFLWNSPGCCSSPVAPLSVVLPGIRGCVLGFLPLCLRGSTLIVLMLVLVWRGWSSLKSGGWWWRLFLVVSIFGLFLWFPREWEALCCFSLVFSSKGFMLMQAAARLVDENSPSSLCCAGVFKQRPLQGVVIFFKSIFHIKIY